MIWVRVTWFLIVVMLLTVSPQTRAQPQSQINPRFDQPNGIAVDLAGGIYVVNSKSGRIVRVNDMTGAGWITFGSSGSGINQFDRFSPLDIRQTGCFMSMPGVGTAASQTVASGVEGHSVTLPRFRQGLRGS